MTGFCPEHGQANTSETLCYVSTLPFQKVCGILVSEKARKSGNLTNDKLAFCCTVRYLIKNQIVGSSWLKPQIRQGVKREKKIAMYAFQKTIIESSLCHNNMLSLVFLPSLVQHLCNFHGLP